MRREGGVISTKQTLFVVRGFNSSLNRDSSFVFFSSFFYSLFVFVGLGVPW